jgi:hypothetical protein
MSNVVWLNWSEIAALAPHRRIVCWGKGEWFSKALPYLPVAPAYIVDNNPNDHGGQFEGARIDAPPRLWAEVPGAVFVVITSTGFVAIAEELVAHGFVPGRDFCVTPTLRDYAVIVAVREHPGVVYFTVSDPPRDDPQTGGGLYRYDLRARRYEKVVPGQPHGIVQGRGEVAYLVDDSVGGVRVLDAQFQTLGALPLPHQSRPHGIGYCPKRHRLYVVMPPLDAIGVLDADTGQMLDRIRLSDKVDRASTAQHHPNDCCTFGNSLFGTMFSRSGNWKLGAFDGCVLEWDLDTHELRGPVVNDLWMPHTPTVINGTLHWADSMRGVVRNTSWKVLAAFHGFVRGLAHDGTFYYVGQSQHRYIGRRLGTSDNISLDSGVFLLDENTKASKFFGVHDIVDINSVYVPRSTR